MAESRGTGREAAADGQSGQCREAEGGGLPEAAGGSKDAPANPEVEAGKVTGGPDKRPNPGDSVSGSGESASGAPASLSGAPAEVAPSTGTGTRKNRLWAFLGRLRGSKFRERPKNGPESIVPVNVRPWTGEILPHVSETRDGSALARIADRIAWATTLPDARYILHAERVRRRRESLVTRALVCFAATFAGKRAGSPPWIAEDGEREGP